MANAAFTASLLRASAEGFAGLAAGRLWEDDSARAAPAGFEAWRGHLRRQVLDLAAAVEDELPERFAARSAWSRDAFAARGVPGVVLRQALDRLGEVLEESLPQPAWSLLPRYLDGARQELARDMGSAASEPSGAGLSDPLALEYVALLLAGDQGRAIDLVLGAVADGRLSIRAALERVLAPAQRELGRRWHAGLIGVAEEHFVTDVTRRVFERLLAQNPAATPNGRTVIVTSVAGDAHAFGVQLVAAFFELDGWRSICLGADIPIEDLVSITTRFNAHLVAIGATLDTQREAVARTIALLRAARPDQKVLVGGAAFAADEKLWRRVGADAWADSPSQAVDVARRLVGA